ncbi:MAG: hypothetical protein ACJ8F3_11250 [Xanthobacteraceae bacterium]
MQMNMDEFERALNWKLLRGCHEFPGPDGGTCVNEVAVVAAGYPYRPVYSVHDMPVTFSRPLSMFALCLNDTLERELRQELLKPLVTRFAATANTAEVELERVELMLQRTIVDIIVPALERAGFSDLARRARSPRTRASVVEIARELRMGEQRAFDHGLLSALEHTDDAAAQLRRGHATEAVLCTFSAIRDIASLDGERHAETVYRHAVEILCAALEIGSPREPERLDVIARRIERVKRTAGLLLTSEDEPATA